MVPNCERFKAISNNTRHFWNAKPHMQGKNSVCIAMQIFASPTAIMHRTLADTLTSVDPMSVVVVARCIEERWSTFLRHLSLLG
jgi:hypothetical protein